MTDVEKRRIKLLQDVRKSYSDKYTPPAVHPRYQSAYSSLYSDEEQVRPRSTFFLRFIISVLILLMFYFADYQTEKQTIINAVQENLLGK